MRMMVLFSVTAAVILLASGAAAHDPPAESDSDSDGDAVVPPHHANRRHAPVVEEQPKIDVITYGEFYYAYNFNDPGNQITNARGFDNRHNTFTVSNVALGVDTTYKSVGGIALFQIGTTPNTYYSSEPIRPGTAASGNSDAQTWKYVQQANAFWKPSDEWTVSAGLFLSPIGAESIAVKDNWNWSRSNLFFGLPFYHTGVQLAFSPDAKDEARDDDDPPKGKWTVTAHAYNGWNNVVDNNGGKTVGISADYKTDTLHFRALYLGGKERASNSPEGSYWRSDFDTFLRWNVSPTTAFIVNVNAGFEPNRFGTSSWIAGAVYGKQALTDWLDAVVRVDAFAESSAHNDSGRATPIFWQGADWVSSATATLDAHVAQHFSIRLEYRHDEAEAPLYFNSSTSGAPVTGGVAPNALRQDTLLLGVTAWCCKVEKATTPSPETTALALRR